MKRSRLAALALATTMLAAGRGASADDAIAAEATFAKGRALMKSGDYAAACAAFELSLSLEHAVGTQLNLATCYEKAGRTASAWLTYREAASAAQSAGQNARATEARERAAKLEPSLCKLVIKVPEDAPASMAVKRDGHEIDRRLWGVAVPVDPGAHQIVATYGGEQAVTLSVSVVAPKDGQACLESSIEVPARHEGPAPVVAPPPPAPPPLAPRVAVAPAPIADAPTTTSWRRPIGVGLGGLGLVGLGVGTGFAIDAIAKRNGADCQAAGCTPGGRTAMQAAGSSADVATVAFATGAVLVAAGTIVWLTTPGAAKTPTTAFRF